MCDNISWSGASMVLTGCPLAPIAVSFDKWCLHQVHPSPRPIGATVVSILTLASSSTLGVVWFIWASGTAGNQRKQEQMQEQEQLWKQICT